LCQSVTQDLAGGSHEGVARQVLLIARLLAYKHDCRVHGTFAEDRLGCISPKIAGLAAASLLSEFIDRSGLSLKIRLCRAKGQPLAALVSF
jgi:hypothetical protein